MTILREPLVHQIDGEPFEHMVVADAKVSHPIRHP